MNKQLWTPSYLFFMAGSCGACLSFFYVICDVLQKPFLRKCVSPLVSLGMNAILLFCWHGPAEELLESVYVQPEPIGNARNVAKHGTLIRVLQKDILQGIFQEKRYAMLVYVILKIVAFTIALHIARKRGYFWKI